MLAEVCSGRSFEPLSWHSNKPQHCLLIATDGISGSLGEDAWPGLSGLHVWICRGPDVIRGRKGKPRCPHPLEPHRRRVPEVAQKLTSALLNLRPEKRCSTKTGHAQAVKFLSDAAPMHVAIQAVLHARLGVDASTPEDRTDDGAPRHDAHCMHSSSDAASQTEHVNRRCRHKRRTGLLSNLHMAVRRMREWTHSGVMPPMSQ